MNNKILIVLVVIIVLLGGGWYFLSSKKQSSELTPTTESLNQSQESQLAQENGSSLKDLFASGISQTCTFNASDESYTSEGTVFVSSNKMRGDFATTVEGQVQKSHMIVDSGTSYVWLDGQTQGFKMTFDENIESSAEQSGTNTGSVDVDAKYNYDCKPGITGASGFELPKGVEFVSLSEMVQEVQGVQDEASSQCDICEDLSAESKTQCLTLLKCN